MPLRPIYKITLHLLLLLVVVVSHSATDKYRCMWREDPATSMVIGWNQISGTQPTLYYDVVDHGTNTDAYRYSQHPDRIINSRGMRNHFVRLRHLEPGTVYYFVIKDSDGCSRQMSFRTIPDHPFERLSIIAGGDSRNYRDARRKANQLVGKLRPHLVLFGGDMTGGDNAKQWQAWFDDWQETITADGRLCPIVVARGNHEYSNKTIVDLFDVAESDGYYALSFADNLLRVYTLNSLIPAGGQQKKWLEKDLQQSQDYIWKMAQYHFAIRPHTARKTERNGQLRHWGKLFHEHQVNLVVESDAHVVKWTYPIRPSKASGSDEGFIRDDETGTVYVGEGCWGAPLRRNNDDKRWTRNSGSFNQFKWIFVDLDQIEVRTVMTDNAEQVAALEPEELFHPPEGLQLWQPDNGSVVKIKRRYGTLAGNVTTPTTRKPMQVLNFAIVTEIDRIQVNWQTEDEPDAGALFQLERSVDKGEFEAIASATAIGCGDYAYTLHDHQIPTCSNQLSYRLKEISPEGKVRVFTTRSIPWKSLKWNNYPRLSPDPESGILQAKYALRQDGDIKIRLVDVTDKVIAWADYKNHRVGSYLKSIDMRRFPDGRYLLTISANNELVGEYLVIK